MPDSNRSTPPSPGRSLSDLSKQLDELLPRFTMAQPEAQPTSAPTAQPAGKPVDQPVSYNFPEVDPAGLRTQGGIPQGSAAPTPTEGSWGEPTLDQPQVTSTNAPVPAPQPRINMAAQEARNYVTTTKAMEQARPKTAREANLLSKAAKDTFVPDYEGNYHFNGKLLTDADVKEKFPDVWGKIHAPKAPEAPETPDSVLDKAIHALGSRAQEAGEFGQAVTIDIGKHPEQIPAALAEAVPKGVHKFGQMVWGGLGGLTQATGDWLRYNTASGEEGGVNAVMGKWLSDHGKELRHFVDSKQVSEALGIGEEGGETPLGQFLSGLASLAPGGAAGKGIGALYGLTGGGETYGAAEDVQAAARAQAIAEGKPDPGVSHLSSAGAALIAGATNLLAGQFMPKGLDPMAVNPLFSEALPREVARAALSAAQLTAGHNVAKWVYDPEARPKDWMDALSKIEEGYFKTLPVLLGAHAVTAYGAYKVANAKDFLGREAKPGEEGTGEKPYATAIMRAQDPSTMRFVTEQIAQAKTPEEAEMVRQRVGAMFERKDTEAEGGFFRGHFDEFFPKITADNWADWGPQIPGVTAPSRSPEARAGAKPTEEPMPVEEAKPKAEAPAPTPAEAPKFSALKPVEKPIAEVQPIRVHGNAVKVTGGEGSVDYGSAGKVEALAEHTPVTSQSVANWAVAQSLHPLLAGSLRVNGVDPDTTEAKSVIRNIIDGISAPNGAHSSDPMKDSQVAERMKQIGMPDEVVAALKDTGVALKAQGIDMSKTPLNRDTTSLPPDQIAKRNWAFINEFHNQLGKHVQEMGVDAPEWLRTTVAKIGNLVAPGGKYDTAYRKGLGLPVQEKAVEHIPTAPIVKEIPHVEAGERPTSSQAAVEEAPKPSAERPGLQQGDGTGEGPGLRADEAGRDTGPVLGEAGGVAIPEHIRAKVEAAKAALRGTYGVDSVKSLHDEYLESTHFPEGKGEEEAGGPKMSVYGPAELLYPAKKDNPDSPYKRVLNLTDQAILHPDFARTLGFSTPGNIAVPGGALWAQLNHPKLAAKMAATKEALQHLGFDAIAYTGAKGASDISPLVSEQAPKALPAGRPTERHKVGVKPKVEPPAQPVELKPEPKPVKITEPIADKAEREQAIEDAKTLVRKHHFTASDLLTLARSVGAPISDKDFQRLMDRDDVENGIASPQQASGLDRRDDFAPGKLVLSPGEMAAKLKAFINDGGFSFSNADGHTDGMSVLGALWRSTDFKQAVETRARYARDQFGPMTRMIAGQPDEPGREGGRGSDTRYLNARNALNKMVLTPKENDKLIDAIKQDVASGKLTPAHNDIVALAIAAMQEFNPNFFSRDAKVIEEMAQRDLAKGVYDTPEQLAKKGRSKVGQPLAQHFEPRAEQHESFMVSDAPVDPRGNNFVEPGNEPNHETGRLPFEPVVKRTIDQIAERGGFTRESLAKAGVPLRPKAQHTASYEAAVNTVNADPKIMGVLIHNGKDLLASPEAMQKTNYLRALVQNGYAHTRLMFEAGKGKKEFHVDAFNVDPEFKQYYTAGEDLVKKINFGTPDGLPVESHIMTTGEIGILLDSNHPMYNRTVEAVAGRIVSDGHIMQAGTTFVRRTVDTPTGPVSVLIPKTRMIGETYSIKPSEGQTVAALTRPAPEATELGKEASGIVIKNAKLVSTRMANALKALKDGEVDWVQGLGDDLMDAYATAQTILDAAKNAKGGDYGMLGQLEGPALVAATTALGDKEAMSKLKGFVDMAKGRLAKAQDPISVAARTRAREIRAIIARSKNDVPWDDIFKGADSPVTLPTAVAENCVRNKEEFLRVLDEMGVSKDDPTTKYMHERLSKLDDVFFEELGTNISQDPDLESGMFDSMRRVIEVAGKLKSEGRSATNIANLMTHEISHAMDPYMSVPMQAAIDRWYRAERDLFIENQAKASKNGRSILGDVLHADASIIDRGSPSGHKILSVSDAYTQKGSLGDIILTPVSTEELLANHPELGKHLRVVTNADGLIQGYQLNRSFFGRDTYKYINFAEFKAETMKEAIRKYASQLSKRPSRDFDTLDRYTVRLNSNAGAKTAMDAAHRSMGRMLDALVGKNTMRRFVGYLMNEAGLLTKGLREGGTYRPSGERDIAFPEMAFQGRGIAMGIESKISGGPPIQLPRETPESAAKEDHARARQVGRAVNVVRALAMTQLNAASVSDKSRAAAYTMRAVMGEQNVSYTAMNRELYNFHKPAEELTKIDGSTRREIKKLAEASNAAQMAKANDLGGVAIVKAGDGAEYAVSVGPDGKYLDATPMANILAQTEYVKTGKFTGSLAGLENTLKPMHDLVWDRLSNSISGLATQIGLETSQISNFDELVKKVENYLPAQYTPRHPLDTFDRLMGRRLKPGMAPEEGRPAEADLPVFNADLGTLDMGINAGMLLEKTFDTPLEAIKAGYFPAHANAIDNVVSGLSNALGVTSRLDALSNLLALKLAVPHYDGGEDTKKWPTMRLESVGLSKDMLGKDLADIRIHPDAMRVLDYAFRPDPLSRTSVGRAMSMASGMMNVTQLAGLNDIVNGIAATQGFGVQLGIKKPGLKAAGAKWVSMAARVAAPAAGAVAAGAAGASPVAGAAIGYLAAKSVATAFNYARAVSAGSLTCISEGRAYQGIIESAMRADRLPKSAQELLRFAQLTNLKTIENPIQIERMSHLATQALRRGKHVGAAAFWLGNLLNKPQQYNDIGLRGVGGKELAKLGITKMLAPAIMDRYRLPNGQVDWTNKQFMGEAIELVDDLDNQVGSIQSKNLHMNPTILATMRVFFRAWNFKFTTERAKALAAADLLNNTSAAIGMAAERIGMNPHKGWASAMREEATGGGTVRPVKKEGDMFSWRKGTIAAANLFLLAAIQARLLTVMSRTIWPDANYSQADLVNKTQRELMGHMPQMPAQAFSSMLSVVPPEGSSTDQALRHVAMEAFAPQIGPNDPTTGRPKSVLPMGAMYGRNIVEQPWQLSWWISGMSGPVSVSKDIIMDQDGLGRPLAFGDPVRNMDWFKRVNTWSEKHVEDNAWYISGARRAVRSAGHFSTNLLPFSARAVDQGGNKAVAVLQGLGGRTMPPTSNLSEAERFAFEQRYPEGAVHTQTVDKVALSREEAAAKAEMASGKSMNKLRSLEAQGKLGPKVGKKRESVEFSRLKREYFDAKTGISRDNLVRLLRGVRDSSPDKRVWKEAWIKGTPKERAAIESHLATLTGKGVSKIEADKIQKLQAWIRTQR